MIHRYRGIRFAVSEMDYRAFQSPLRLWSYRSGRGGLEKRETALLRPCGDRIYRVDIHTRVRR